MTIEVQEVLQLSNVATDLTRAMTSREPTAQSPVNFAVLYFTCGVFFVQHHAHCIHVHVHHEHAPRLFATNFICELCCCNYVHV